MKTQKTSNTRANNSKHNSEKPKNNKVGSKANKVSHKTLEEELPVAIVIEKAREGGEKIPEHIFGL